MDFFNVKSIDIYGTNCIVDISRGSDDCVRFVSAKEKYFDLKSENGALTVSQKSRNILLRLISGKIEFKLILPRAFKGKLRYRNNNGGMYIKDVDFSDIELATNNGKFEIDSTSCESFSLKVKNGSVNVKNLDARDGINIKCSNGNIKAEGLVCPAITVSCSNAGLSAADIKSKKMDCSTSNGSIDVSAVDAADIKLETSNGKINAMLLGSRSNYRLAAETSHGSITVDGVPGKNISEQTHAAKKLTVKTSNGDIDIRFL